VSHEPGGHAACWCYISSMLFTWCKLSTNKLGPLHNYWFNSTVIYTLLFKRFVTKSDMYCFLCWCCIYVVLSNARVQLSCRRCVHLSVIILVTSKLINRIIRFSLMGSPGTLVFRPTFIPWITGTPNPNRPWPWKSPPRRTPQACIRAIYAYCIEADDSSALFLVLVQRGCC